MYAYSKIEHLLDSARYVILQQRVFNFFVFNGLVRAEPHNHGCKYSYALAVNSRQSTLSPRLNRDYLFTTKILH